MWVALVGMDDRRWWGGVTASMLACGASEDDGWEEDGGPRLGFLGYV